MSNLFLFPIRQIRNNAVQSGMHVNVAKDLTTADDGAFAADRAKYVDVVNAAIHTGPTQLREKKWMNSCANRDASSVAERRRVRAQGLSLNVEGQTVCNMSKIEHNTRDTALRRARAGGANVPKKVTKRPTTDGAPAISLRGHPLIRSNARLPWLENPNEIIQ